MKSSIRHSKASGSTKRRIYEIVRGIGKYSPRRLERERQARWETTQALKGN